MKRSGLLLLTVLLMIMLLSANLYSEGQLEGSRGAEYVGMDTCQRCHTDIYDQFVKSGHPYKLNKVENGKPPNYPFTSVPKPPEGYTWDEISYVIGGYNWKARFMGKDGFIITDNHGDAEGFLGQYNFANPNVGTDAHWVAYHPGEEKPYNCGPCHVEGGKASVKTDSELINKAYNYHARTAL